MNTYRVWTKQNAAILDELRQFGRHIAKEEFLHGEHEDTAEIMLLIYRWLSDHMPLQQVRPADAVLPVWVSPVKAATMAPSEGYVTLELEVPADEICFIDIAKWTTITNYSYISTGPGDNRRHRELMEAYGTNDVTAVRSPFYPILKKEITDSWIRLFDLSGAPGGPGCYGLLWEVKREWIRSIEP